METLNSFKFKLFSDPHKLGWSYEIYTEGLTKLIIKSNEIFKSQGIARYAAIGHITLLENNFSTQ